MFKKRIGSSLFVLILLASTINVAQAHFKPGTVVREFVLTHAESTTEVYVRTPIPLVFGDVLSGAAVENEFLINRSTASEPQWYLSQDKIDSSRAAFAKRLTNSLQWKVGLESVSSRVRAYRVIKASERVSAFQSSSIARASLKESSSVDDVAIGAGYIDMLVSIDARADAWPLRVRAGVVFTELPPDVHIDNHFFDERDKNKRKFTKSGQLSHAQNLPSTFIGWMVEYVIQGTLHIIMGFDHLLLVAAMTLGISSALMLIRCVTAFTLGHAITLVVAFLGYSPQIAWFIPAIELAIALSVVAAALGALFSKSASVLVYCVVGLLHGFGFSFVLGDILRRDSPELIQALSAFIFGIEIGQLIIIGLTLALIYVVKRAIPTYVPRVRNMALVMICVFAVMHMDARFLF